MNLLEMLMGNSETRQGFEDFVNRFDDGPDRKSNLTLITAKL